MPTPWGASRADAGGLVRPPPCPGTEELSGSPSDCAGHPRRKAALEALVAASLLVLTAPVILLCALLVKLTSRGPAFCSQVRIGRHGCAYRAFTLRTTAHDGERISRPRVTSLGWFMRRSHLAERLG